MREFKQTDDYRNLCSKNAKKLWSDPVYREKQKDKPNRSKEFLAKIKALQSKVSKLAETFYSILDDLDIKHYREYNNKPDDVQCQVGPYSVDCVIPRPGLKTLLIDIHGEYYHSRSEQITQDKAKGTYFNEYLTDLYEYKVIWEYEFLNRNRVVDLVQQWLGMKIEIQVEDFDLKSIIVKEISTKDCRSILSKYHYLHTAGMGGIAFGAYINNIQVAVCVFSPLRRQNIFGSLPVCKNPRELSRFCIHPKYQKKNFASWFISRCIKLLPVTYDLIISYADTTFDHDGTIYKACNFTLDREVPPDYWYINEAGWVMNKKTLYNHAVRNHSTENDWAILNGYNKVWGKKKLRFIFKRLN